MQELASGTAPSLREDGLDIRAVYERNDGALRDKEGLDQGKGFLPLPGEDIHTKTMTQISENGVKYTADFENGQKTGFFLDRKSITSPAALQALTGQFVEVLLAPSLRHFYRRDRFLIVHADR